MDDGSPASGSAQRTPGIARRIASTSAISAVLMVFDFLAFVTFLARAASGPGGGETTVDAVADAATEWLVRYSAVRVARLERISRISARDVIGTAVRCLQAAANHRWWRAYEPPLPACACEGPPRGLGGLCGVSRVRASTR